MIFDPNPEIYRLRHLNVVLSIKATNLEAEIAELKTEIERLTRGLNHLKSKTRRAVDILDAALDTPEGR